MIYYTDGVATGVKKYIEDLKINIDDMKMGIIDKGYY